MTSDMENRAENEFGRYERELEQSFRMDKNKNSSTWAVNILSFSSIHFVSNLRHQRYPKTEKITDFVFSVANRVKNKNRFLVVFIFLQPVASVVIN